MPIPRKQQRDRRLQNRLGSGWQTLTAVTGRGFANPPQASYKVARFGLCCPVRTSA